MRGGAAAFFTGEEGTGAFFTGEGGIGAFFTGEGGIGAFFVGDGGIGAFLIGELGVLVVMAEDIARQPTLLTAEVGVAFVFDGGGDVSSLTRGRDGDSFDVGEEFPPFFVCLR